MTIITTTKQMRPRDPADFYPTPVTHVRAALDGMAEFVGYTPCAPSILDPGAGTGVWGGVARDLWQDARITGVELRDVEPHAAYDDWRNEDYRLWDRPRTGFDMIVGNPPYKYAEPFTRLGLSQLAPHGVMCFLLRLAFLEGQDRGRDLWQRYPPCKVLVCSERPSFTGDGNTDATAYAIYYWREGWQGDTTLGWLKT